MTAHEHHKSAYLTRRIVAARNVLADPTATTTARHGARCRLNRAAVLLRELTPVPPMKRGLEVDRLARRRRISP